MKRSNSDRTKSTRTERGSGIKWDEANLEENDKIKAALNPTKIHEPKTPYHGPTLTEDDELDVLDIAEVPGMSPSRPEQENLAQEHTTLSGDNKPSMPEEETAFRGQQAQRYTTSEDAESTERSSGEGEGQQEKRQRFLGHRKEHYDMRGAIRRGKELLAHELVDEQQVGNGSLQVDDTEGDSC